MSWTITKTCSTCEHFPNYKHCIGCEWDESKRENTKWELKKNPIVIERVVLDKIRAEIEQFAKNPDFGDLSLGASCGAMRALEIINKYIAEGSEE